MNKSFNPENWDRISNQTLESTFKVGDKVETTDGIRTIIIEDVNSKLIYSVRVNHKDGSAKEYKATGPEIALAKNNPSTIMQWEFVRNIPMEEIRAEAA